MRNSFFSIFLLTLFCQQSSAQQTTTNFGRNEVLEDLAHLINFLEDAHINLYAYTSKEEFLKNYQGIKNSIKEDSVDILGATNIFQRVSSAAYNGHTEIDFPITPYRTYAFSGGTLFPLEIAFENNKGFIRKNFSANPTIRVGSEIISINGIELNEILAKIYPQISAERTYYKNAKIEMYSFPRLYWQVFGRQDQFEIEVKDGENSAKYSINAVNLIDGYEAIRTDFLGTTRDFKFIDAVGFINPGPFSGDETEYQHFIDSAFAEINDQNTETLILDLRNNSGGDNSFSDYMVSYIADKPFQWNSKLSIKTSAFLKEYTRELYDTTDIYFKNILTRENGEVYAIESDDYPPKDTSQRFHGKVYVLVNRQSYSQAAVTAAQIQDYSFGTIVGEETGDYPTLYASQFHYSLPNTGIVVKVSKGQIVRVNGSEKQEGVIPDIIIQDHLLDDEDEILNGLLEKLK
jgi:hypothetical protein